MKRRRSSEQINQGKFSQVLAELRDAIAVAYVTELKMTPEAAKTAADMAMERIKDTTGGAALYVAKGHLWAVTENHWRIYRRFTGANHAQLAREFDLTERQVYTIVARCQQEEFERRQIPLFVNT